MKFRKKPIVIEAWENSVANNQGQLPSWFEGVVKRLPGRRLAIRTPEGTMVALPHDWVIRGVKGEVYPCKPDIFAETYERVTE